MKGINNLALEIYHRNIDKGFYEKEKNIGEMLALMHSEISEALEADRKSKYYQGDLDSLNGIQIDTDFVTVYNDAVKGTFEEEMADIFIRVLDMCAYKGIDLESHVIAKMRYNQQRPHKHGKNY